MLRAGTEENESASLFALGWIKAHTSHHVKPRTIGDGDDVPLQRIGLGPPGDRVRYFEHGCFSRLNGPQAESSRLWHLPYPIPLKVPISAQHRLPASLLSSLPRQKVPCNTHSHRDGATCLCPPCKSCRRTHGGIERSQYISLPRSAPKQKSS